VRSVEDYVGEYVETLGGGAIHVQKSNAFVYVGAEEYIVLLPSLTLVHSSTNEARRVVLCSDLTDDFSMQLSPEPEICIIMRDFRFADEDGPTVISACSSLALGVDRTFSLGLEPTQALLCMEQGYLVNPLPGQSSASYMEERKNILRSAGGIVDEDSESSFYVKCALVLLDAHVEEPHGTIGQCLEDLIPIEHEGVKLFTVQRRSHERQHGLFFVSVGVEECLLRRVARTLQGVFTCVSCNKSGSRGHHRSDTCPHINACLKGECDYLIEDQDEFLDRNADFDDSNTLRHFDTTQELSPLYLLRGSVSAYSLRQRCPLGPQGNNDPLRLQTLPDCNCDATVACSLYKKGYIVAREGEFFFTEYAVKMFYLEIGKVFFYRIDGKNILRKTCHCESKPAQLTPTVLLSTPPPMQAFMQSRF